MNPEPLEEGFKSAVTQPSTGWSAKPSCASPKGSAEVCRGRRRCSRGVADSSARGRSGPGNEGGLLPDDGRVSLADGDVVGGPLHVHAPDRESCGQKTEQSKKRSLQLPPARSASEQHLEGQQERVSVIDPGVVKLPAGEISSSPGRS